MTQGHVLLPVDAAGRLLELVLLLEEHWDKQKLMYPLVLLTPMAYNVLELASSQLEWMSHHVGQMFERTKHNPFSVRQAIAPASHVNAHQLDAI